MTAADDASAGVGAVPDPAAEVCAAFPADQPPEKGLFAFVLIAAMFMILYSPSHARFPFMSPGYFGRTTDVRPLCRQAGARGALCRDL